MRHSNTTRNRSEKFVKNLKFNYDELNDLLYLYKGHSSVYTTVMIGEFHLELNREGDIVGLEVLHASEILGEYEIPKKILQNIRKAQLRIVARNNSLLVFLTIHAAEEEHSAAITMNNLEAPIMAGIAEA
jgi:uncharacterized protein YuzE